MSILIRRNGWVYIQSKVWCKTYVSCVGIRRWQRVKGLFKPNASRFLYFNWLGRTRVGCNWYFKVLLQLNICLPHVSIFILLKSLYLNIKGYANTKFFCLSSSSYINHRTWSNVFEFLHFTICERFQYRLTFNKQIYCCTYNGGVVNGDLNRIEEGGGSKIQNRERSFL